MTKTKIIASSIFAGGALALVAAIAVQTASAAPNEAPAGGTPAARILMVDLSRVIAEAKVGHDMQRQIETLKAQTVKELDGDKDALMRERQAIQQQSAILAESVKQQRVRSFDAKYQAFQAKAEKRGAMLQTGVLKAQGQIEQALGPILQGIMSERGATILLDRRGVLLAHNAIDVSAVATQRLDTKLSSVKVELVEPPANAARQPR